LPGADPNDGHGGASVVKFGPAPDYAYLAESPLDVDGDDGAGYHDMIGIVYSSMTNTIYTSSLSATEDCLYAFDTDLNPLGALVGPAAGNGQAKGVVIRRECCPTEPNQTINLVQCINAATETLYLNEIFPCDGLICEAAWEPADATTRSIFNSCDQSLLPTVTAGCYTFTRSSDGMGPNNICGIFNQTFNLEILEVPDMTVSEDQFLPCDQAVAPLVATTSASVIRWEMNTINCDAADDWVAIPNSAANSFTPTAPTTTTHYRAVIGGSSVGQGACPGGDCELESDCVTIFPSTTTISISATPASCTDNMDGTFTTSYRRNDQYHPGWK